MLLRCISPFIVYATPFALRFWYWFRIFLFTPLFHIDVFIYDFLPADFFFRWARLITFAFGISYFEDARFSFIAFFHYYAIAAAIDIFTDAAATLLLFSPYFAYFAIWLPPPSHIFRWHTIIAFRFVCRRYCFHYLFLHCCLLRWIFRLFTLWGFCFRFLLIAFSPFITIASPCFSAPAHMPPPLLIRRCHFELIDYADIAEIHCRRYFSFSSLRADIDAYFR